MEVLIVKIDFEKPSSGSPLFWDRVDIVYVAYFSRVDYF
jgi:hypothetical protein